MATCYKVVSQGVFPGHYNSVVTHPHPWEVSYKPGMWIRAPQQDTGLFVFETLVEHTPRRTRHGPTKRT